MTENGYWETKTYRSGKVGEKVKYFVPYRRSRGRGKNDASKIASNCNNTARRAGRCVNNNFVAGDGWLTLSFDQRRYQRVLARAARLMEQDPDLSEQDAIWFAAQHEGELLMDRVRREAARQGKELRYLLVTSDMDGDTGELVRVHLHLIVCAECKELVMAKWGGEEFRDPNRPEWKDRLWDMEDYTPLVEYMLKQVRHIPNAKKYTPSRNLMRPEPKARRVISGARLREPKGCTILYADPYTGRHSCQYIRYLLPEEQWAGVWAADKLTRNAHTPPRGRGTDINRARSSKGRSGGGGG